MLQQIRDRTTGLIAGFIVAIIAIPFAFFGIDQFTGGGGDPVVAKVGDQKIHESQFRRQYEQRYQQFVQLMGENFRADMVDQNRLREIVLRDMTQEAMLRQYTGDRGYRVDDGTLFRALAGEPAFQRDGSFDTQAYREALARVGYTTDRYESQLRDSIQMNQMREAIVETAFVTEADARLLARLQGQERAFQYAQFPIDRYRERAEIGEDEIAARYEARRTQYTAPERIRLAYVELSFDTLPEGEAPGGDVLQVLYEAEKAGRFTTQEERKARHILVGFGADPEAAKRKIQGIAASIKAGAGFAEMASAASEDPGSRNAGGDLGWVRRGQMVKTFEDVLFALAPGEVSAPVETEFGWHLIQLDELRPSVTRSLDEPEVRAELVELFQTRERQQRFQDMSDRLEQLAFENPASLQPVAEALQLEVQTTDWFARGQGTGIAANPGVAEVAFSPEIVQDNENSKPLSLGDNRIVVVRKAEYEAPRQRPLDEVRDAIRAELADEAARRLVEADAAEVLAAARGGADFQELAAAKNAELRNPGAVRRDASGVDRQVLDAAFRLARPAQGASSYGEVSLADGSRAVIALSEVRMPELVDAAPEQRQRLRDASAGGEFGAYMRVIQDRVGVEILRPQSGESARLED